MVLGLLQVNPQGVVQQANPAATDLLGASTSIRCNELVRGRDADGQPVCRAGCAASICAAGTQRTARAVKVRGKPWRLTCSALGRQVIVVMQPEKQNELGPTESLTDRERDVLALVARGLTTARIAKQLGIRPATVRTHVERVREKLGARTRAEAVARAIEAGALSPPAEAK